MAKTIKIFLVDGEPNGLKTAELSNWVGQAIVIPRNKLKEIRQRQDCNKPAVYFLIGKETGKKYDLDLTSEKAFGKRDIKKNYNHFQ